MNKRFWYSFLLIVLAFTVVSCEFSASTANISGAKMSADSAGGTETAVFKSDQIFYDIVTLANAPDSTKVKVVWYFMDNPTNPTKIVEKEIVGSGSPITFNASNANAWPVGKYKVELYLNDKLDRTQEFSVE